MSHLAQALSANVRRLRRERDWTQQELAERAGVSPRTIQRLEQAPGNVRTELIERLARALGVDPHELVTSLPGPPRKAGRRG